MIVFDRNPDTSNWMVWFVNEVYLICLVIHSNFYHGPCSWNYGSMPSLILFGGHLNWFSIPRPLSSKNSLYALNLPNEVRNVWNSSMLVWMLNNYHIKRLGFKGFKNNLMPLCCDCFWSKPWYFELNGPICERSVSNLSSNAMKLLPRTMFVK